MIRLVESSARRQTGKRWLAALLALALSQAVFWPLLGLGEYAVFPRGAQYTSSIAMQRLGVDGEILDRLAIPVPLHPAPVYRFRDDSGAAQARFVHHFDYPPAAGEWGLYLSTSRRIDAVRLNGQAMSARAPLDTWSILGGFDPVLYDLPADALKPGRNQLSFDVRGVSGKILPVFFVGEFEPLFNAYAWSQLISVDLVVAAIGVMLFVALLCALTPWSSADRQRVHALIALLLLWSLRNLSFFGLDSAIPPPWRQVVHYQLTYLFLFAIAWFAACWTGFGSSRPRIYAGGALVSLAAAFAAGLTGDNARVFQLLFPIESALSYSLVGLALLRLARYAADGGVSRRLEALLFMVCLTAVGVDAVDDRFDLSLPLLPHWPLTFYAAPLCGLLLALGSCAILVSQSQRARTLLESLNAVMDRRLAEQADALSLAHDRERSITRERAVMAERQRLMRDMHDGLGGQLVSLLMRFRNGTLSAEESADEIGRALDDLRLIVASLDHADENIGIALGSFRERVEPRLRDAGLQLAWHVEPRAGRRRLPAEQMLHLLRILQEASTNTLKHADASRISIALDCSPDGLLRLIIADDGRGFDVNAVGGSGKGLANLHQRARKLGAELSLSSDAGTSIVLLLPTSSDSH